MRNKIYYIYSILLIKELPFKNMYNLSFVKTYSITIIIIIKIKIIIIIIIIRGIENIAIFLKHILRYNYLFYLVYDIVIVYEVTLLNYTY